MQGYEAAAAQAPTRLGPACSRSSYGKALYVGNLASSMSQETLQEVFSTLGPVGEITIIQDKSKGLNAGYGFVQYLDQRAAEMALHLLNGKVLHGQELRINWAYRKDQRGHSSLQFQIFVGELASNVNDKMLLDAFIPYGCTDVRVIWNHKTGLSKGYGFIAFKSQLDAEKALACMSGVVLGSRRIRCVWAQQKQETSSASYAAVDQDDPENANIYIGNLAAAVTDVVLWRHVAQFGVVIDIKFYQRRGYAFAQYATHADAARAIVALSGRKLGGKALRSSWSRHQARMAGTDPLQAGLAGDYSILTLQQQQQQQQQLAMQQFAYPQGYTERLALLGIEPGADFQGQLTPQQQLAAQQVMSSMGAYYLSARQQALGIPQQQQQLDHSRTYCYPGDLYH